MKILNAFNMAQDAYHVTKAMRHMGIEADLLVFSDKAAKFSDPRWEDPEASKSPWIKTFKKDRFVSDKINVLKIMSLMNKYDVVFCHVPSSLYAQFVHRAYVPYDAGLIRYLPHSKRMQIYPKKIYSDIRLHMLLLSYRRAKRVLYTNPDTTPFFRLAGIDESRLRFVPFFIDTERYKPVEIRQQHDGLVFFAPARHKWSEKGNDVLLKAYAKYDKEFNDTTLILAEWGLDVERSKTLVHELQIHSVKFVPVMNKPNLIRMYQNSNVVFDQFILGSYGTAAPEAMACGVPVVIYLSQWHEKCYGEAAPTVNACNSEQIYDAMVRLRDASYRQQLGKLSREYVLKHHSAEKVVKTHMIVAEEVAGGKR